MTFELVLIPGYGQADKATHCWEGLCRPLFLTGKQLRETQDSTSGFPLNQPSPTHSLAACTALQKLGLTQEEELATPFFTRLMVLG